MAAATGVKRFLLTRAINSKIEGLRSNNLVSSGIWDALVFKKMKLLMGGRVKLMITGSAPIAGEVTEFLKVCFCCPISQGYGMTESSAGSFLQFLDEHSSGNCGGPLANIKYKLKSIPEMGYDA